MGGIGLKYVTLSHSATNGNKFEIIFEFQRKLKKNSNVIINKTYMLLCKFY